MFVQVRYRICDGFKNSIKFNLQKMLRNMAAIYFTWLKGWYESHAWWHKYEDSAAHPLIIIINNPLVAFYGTRGKEVRILFHAGKNGYINSYILHCEQKVTKRVFFLVLK